jgi:hypothetical protein
MANMASMKRTLESFRAKEEALYDKLGQVLKKYLMYECPNKEFIINNGGDFYNLAYNKPCKLLKVKLSDSRFNCPIAVNFIENFGTPEAKEVTQPVYNLRVLISLYYEIYYQNKDMIQTK